MFSEDNYTVLFNGGGEGPGEWVGGRWPKKGWEPLFYVDLVITWSGDIKAIEVCLQCYQSSFILDLF